MSLSRPHVSLVAFLSWGITELRSTDHKTGEEIASLGSFHNSRNVQLSISEAPDTKTRWSSKTSCLPGCRLIRSSKAERSTQNFLTSSPKAHHQSFLWGSAHHSYSCPTPYHLVLGSRRCSVPLRERCDSKVDAASTRKCSSPSLCRAKALSFIQSLRAAYCSAALYCKEGRTVFRNTCSLSKSQRHEGRK